MHHISNHLQSVMSLNLSLLHLLWLSLKGNMTLSLKFKPDLWPWPPTLNCRNLDEKRIVFRPFSINMILHFRGLTFSWLKEIHAKICSLRPPWESDCSSPSDPLLWLVGGTVRIQTASSTWRAWRGRLQVKTGQQGTGVAQTSPEIGSLISMPLPWQQEMKLEPSEGRRERRREGRRTKDGVKEKEERME